ncbi:MAG: hypothetical protein H6704_14185 [Myxococcales bacterium]|nr:hypothetical protein [Myxococcales bacterium]
MATQPDQPFVPPRAPSQQAWDAMSPGERQRVVDTLPNSVTEAELPTAAAKRALADARRALADAERARAEAERARAETEQALREAQARIAELERRLGEDAD